VVIHVVQRGDTLYHISIRYGVGMDVIQAANRLPDPGRLIVGQALVIPAPPGPRPVTTVNGYLPDTGARGQRIMNELGTHIRIPSKLAGIGGYFSDTKTLTKVQARSTPLRDTIRVWLAPFPSSGRPFAAHIAGRWQTKRPLATP